MATIFFCKIDHEVTWKYTILTSQQVASLYVVRQYIANSIGKQPLEWLSNHIPKNIREFHLEKFEEDVQKESVGGSIWLLAIRIKGSHTTTNSSIQGRVGVNYDALDKGTAAVECLEDQFYIIRFQPNDSDYRFQYHYIQGRPGVQLFQNTNVDSQY